MLTVLLSAPGVASEGVPLLSCEVESVPPPPEEVSPMEVDAAELSLSTPSSESEESRDPFTPLLRGKTFELGPTLSISSIDADIDVLLAPGIAASVIAALAASRKRSRASAGRRVRDAICAHSNHAPAHVR